MQRLIFAILVWMCASGILQAQTINFQPTSPEAAMTLSAQQNKPVLFMAYQGTCGHCEKMINEVFPDTSVSNFYNANYI